MAALSVRLLSARDEGLPPDLELAAYLYLPPKAAHTPVPGLVVGHGASSRAARHEPFCLEACARGFAVLALDFRGHGDSQGAGDGPLEEDVLAAVRFLREHPAVDPRVVCYRGSSMGGFYGLRAVADADFAAMVLLCPASARAMLDAIERDEDDDAQRDTEAPDDDSTESAASHGDGMTRWDMPRLRAYFERQDTRSLAARVRCPVLVVHPRGDEIVPLSHSLTLVEHLPAETTLLALEGGSHFSAQHDPAIHAYTLAWLTEEVSRLLGGSVW